MSASNKAKMAESDQIKYLNLPLIYLFICYLYDVFYQLPVSVLSAFVSKPLGDGWSFFLAHRAPGHYEKRHMGNIV